MDIILLMTCPECGEFMTSTATLVSENINEFWLDEFCGLDYECGCGYKCHVLDINPLVKVKNYPQSLY